MHSYAHGSGLAVPAELSALITFPRASVFSMGKILKALGDLMGSLGFVGTDSIASPI